MATFSLSLYRISINRVNSPDELMTLDCFDNGLNIADIINSMLTVWHTSLHNSGGYSFGVGALSDSTPRVSRIKQSPSDGFVHYRAGGYISGIIESGAYGTEQSIVDQKSGAESYHKIKDDAALVPFYFCFYFPRNSRFGYLLLERIGNDGIFTMISDAIRSEVNKYISGRYTLKILPYMLDWVFDRNVNSLMDASKIFLRGVRSDVFKAGFPLASRTGDGYIETEVVLSMRGMKSVIALDILRDLIRRHSKRQRLEVDGVECADVAFQVKIGGRKRKVSIARLENLGTNLDVTHEVTVSHDGYPTYDSIHKEANRIISEIKNETGE